jgi:hypothetical protein
LNRILAGLQVALDVAAAYQKTREPKKPRIAADAVLLIFAGLLICTSVGFGLAAAFLAMHQALGGPIAALLTSVIAFAAALTAFLISRWLMRPQR